MSKQSSVEWYINNLIEILGDEIINKLTIEQTNQIHSLGNKAVAMHKEECIKYYVDAIDYGDMGQHIRELLIEIAEKIYNETFGGEQ